MKPQQQRLGGKFETSGKTLRYIYEGSAQNRGRNNLLGLWVFDWKEAEVPLLCRNQRTPDIFPSQQKVRVEWLQW